MIIELSHQGYSGYGEATEILYYGKDLDRMIALVKSHQTWVELLNIIDPVSQYQLLLEKFHSDRFVLCALDMAYHDLYGKMMGKPCWQLWNLNIDHSPLSSLTVGIQSIPEMLTHIDENPWPIYKVKLGTHNDMEIMKAIRAHTDKPLRVDANAGWSLAQSIEYSSILKELQVDYIEQPLAMEDFDQMKEVFIRSALPLIADESCHIPEDVEKCIDHFHGINIKLMKCGGLTPALEMISLARKYNLKIMIGCMTETSIGISALAQLLPLVDYADLDGSLLISNDPARGVFLDYGKAIYPNTNGTGAELINSHLIQ